MLGPACSPAPARARCRCGPAPRTKTRRRRRGIESHRDQARPIPHFERGRPDVKRFGELEFRGGLVLELAVGELRRLVGPGHGGGRQQPAGRSPTSAAGSPRMSSTTAAGRSALRARASGRCSTAAANRSTTSASRTQKPLTLVDGNLHERHAADRLRAPASHRPLPDPRQRGAGAHRLLKMPADAKRHARKPGHRRPRRAARPARARARSWPSPSADARQRLSHRLDLDRRRAASASSCRTSTASTSPTRRAWPDGGLLVLERYFRWSEGVKMRIRHIAAGEIEPGARIAGRTSIEADSASRSTTWKAWPCTGRPAAKPSCR